MPSLDLGLDIVDRVIGVHIKCNGLVGLGLDEAQHATAAMQHQVQGALLL